MMKIFGKNINFIINIDKHLFLEIDKYLKLKKKIQLFNKSSNKHLCDYMIYKFNNLKY